MSCFRGRWDFFCRGFVPTSVASVASIFLSLQACHHVRSAGLAICSKHVPMVTPLFDDEPNIISSLTLCFCSVVKAPFASSLRIISRIRCASTIALMQARLCLRDMHSSQQRRAPLPRVQWVSALLRCGRRCVCACSQVVRNLLSTGGVLTAIAHVGNEIIPCLRCPEGHRDCASAEWLRRQRSRIATTRSSRVSLILRQSKMTGRRSHVVASTCTLGAFQVHSNRNACIPHPASSPSNNSMKSAEFRALAVFSWIHDGCWCWTPAVKSPTWWLSPVDFQS